MINSRKLSDLLDAPRARFEAFLDTAANDDWLRRHGIAIIVISTYRDAEAQAALYAQGRGAPGKIVTRARPGQSMHNWRCAGDVLPLRNGKPVWGTSGNGLDEDAADDDQDDLEVWQRIGKIGIAAGLSWAGDWETFREFPHFQYTGGLTLADLRAGRSVA